MPDADGADVVVVRDGDGWALAEGVTAAPVAGARPDAAAVERHAPTARWTRCRATAPAPPTSSPSRWRAESVGVAQRTMEMAVDYAKEREQFGRPIGAYQAVSHACAQMLLEVEGARSVVLYAAWALDHEPESGPLAASMAKAYASDAGWRVPAAALQVHGGIGFTWEHDLHLWLKRGKANAYLWGDAREHRARVADLIGL